jgi:molybdate transport system substrate-binding protein
VALAFTTAAFAADVKVIASNALRGAYLELVPQYEKASGNKVTLIWGPAVEIPKRVEGGERADLVILPAAGINDLIRKGILAPGSRADLVKSLIGVAVRPGTPRPDLSSVEGMKRALIESNSIVLSGGTSSFYLKELFEKMGVAAAIKPKMKQYGPESGLGVGQVLARGEGDLGFTQVSEFAGVKGIDYVGPLPPGIQQVTVFSAGLFKDATSPGIAAELVKFLNSAAAAPVLAKHGLEPS